jgi:hypothetical protein
MARTVFESPFFGALLFGLSKFYLKLSGWRRVGRMPEVLRRVMIAAPPHLQLGRADHAGHGFCLPPQGALVDQTYRIPLALPQASEMAGGDPHRPYQIDRRGDPDG